jgi:hypothetical protein
MKKYLGLLAAVAALISCNSNGDKVAGHTDSTGHEMHTVTTAEMPPMPEIPDSARVFFANLTDSQTVISPLKIEMGVDGLSVDTANGKLKPSSGHHHILIDIDSIARETVVVKDSTHLHYGNAQTTAEVKLSPGKHVLTLQFADALHRSYGSRLTSRVTVFVE